MDPEEQAENRRNGRDGSGRFRPGVSGNPRGRPAGSVSARTALRQELAAHPRRLRAVVGKLLAAAEAGEPWAVRAVFEQLDGRPVASVTLEHSGGLLLDRDPERPLVLRHNPERPTNGASPPSTAERLRAALGEIPGPGPSQESP